MRDKTLLEEAISRLFAEYLDEVDAESFRWSEWDVKQIMEITACWLAGEVMKGAELVDLPGLVTTNVVRVEDFNRLMGSR